MLSKFQTTFGTKKAMTGFTLTEVVVSIAILGIVVSGLIHGYVGTAQHSEWSAHSLAAQSLAAQGVEQARAAKWDPQAWPVVDELPPTNYMQVDTLDVPVLSGSQPEYATNFISITTISSNPPLRQLRADCVWRFGSRGLFTNTQITLRAADQ